MDIAGLNDSFDLTDSHWVDKIPMLPGVSLNVRSVNLKAYTKARDRALRELVGDDQLTPDELEDRRWLIIGEKMADHLLVDWKGVTEGGKPVEFTVDRGRALLMADDPHDIGERFRRGVDFASATVAARLAKKASDLAKN